MPDLEHSSAEAAVVAAQLGRAPRGRWAVAKYCHLGVPMAIESHPVLEDGSPFPTLYWLTCPMLLKRVSQIESSGAMNSLNDRLAGDSALRERLDASLARLKSRRDEHAVIEDSGAPPGGGSEKVKCLHAHTAQELAQPGNPAGALALGWSGWPDCRQPCVVASGEDAQDVAR